jgi:hypothetical protein
MTLGAAPLPLPPGLISETELSWDGLVVQALDGSRMATDIVMARRRRAAQFEGG